MKERIGNKGLAIAALVVLGWALLLAYCLSPYNEVARARWPILAALMLLQTHLFTGLFITAHDAMHGTVYPANMRLNHAIGRLCALLFVFNAYTVLLPKHHGHHRFVGTGNDPDFHHGNPSFWRWYVDFLREYIGWKQVVLAAITFNALHYGLGVAEPQLILFWVLPSLLSTLQLFYFGTYSPHRGEHAPGNVHKASTLPKNHVWAFVSCYFFGYHYEHHDSPATPWWLLWEKK